MLLPGSILRINALDGLEQKVALAIEPIREGIVRRLGCRLFAQIDGDRQGFFPAEFHAGDYRKRAYRTCVDSSRTLQRGRSMFVS
jgi:hypothetical protein